MHDARLRRYRCYCGKSSLRLWHTSIRTAAVIVLEKKKILINIFPHVLYKLIVFQTIRNAENVSLRTIRMCTDITVVHDNTFISLYVYLRVGEKKLVRTPLIRK